MAEDRNELLDILLNIPAGYELSFRRMEDYESLEVKLRYDNKAGCLMYRKVLTYQELMLRIPTEGKVYILVHCIKEMIFKIRHEIDKVNPEGTHYRRWGE